MPSCATLASSALRRCFIEVRSWRCHTQRTPAGEIDNPPLQCLRDAHLAPGRLFDRQLNHRLFNLDWRAVLQYRFAPADLLQRQLAAFVVQLLEPVKAVAAVPHHLASVAHIAELLGQFEQTDLRPDDLLFLCHIVISVPPAGGSRSQLGVRTATRPPAPFGKPTTTVRLNAS